MILDWQLDGTCLFAGKPVGKVEIVFETHLANTENEHETIKQYMFVPNPPFTGKTKKLVIADESYTQLRNRVEFVFARNEGILR